MCQVNKEDIEKSVLSFCALMEIQNRQIGRGMTLNTIELKNETVEILIPSFKDNLSFVTTNGNIEAIKIGAQLNGTNIQCYVVLGFLDLTSKEAIIGFTETNFAQEIDSNQFSNLLTTAVSNWVMLKSELSEISLKAVSTLVNSPLQLRNILNDSHKIEYEKFAYENYIGQWKNGSKVNTNINIISGSEMINGNMHLQDYELKKKDDFSSLDSFEFNRYCCEKDLYINGRYLINDYRLYTEYKGKTGFLCTINRGSVSLGSKVTLVSNNGSKYTTIMNIEYKKRLVNCAKEGQCVVIYLDGNIEEYKFFTNCGFLLK